jgi:hypothetical protein
MGGCVGDNISSAIDDRELPPVFSGKGVFCQEFVGYLLSGESLAE